MKKNTMSTVGTYLILVLLGLFFLGPFIWNFLTSIKNDLDLFSIPPVFIPKHPTIKNYVEVLSDGGFQSFMKNSLITTIISTVISLLIGIPAAYGFAKYRYRLSWLFYGVIVAIRMFPPIILGIPYFLMMSSWGLINTTLSLIIAYIPLQLTIIVWILEGFFRQIPGEILEAGETDGLGTIGKLVYIVVPLSLPSIGVATLLGMLASWNEFLYAITLTGTVHSQTLPVGIAGYVTSYQTFFGQMSAAGMLYILPVLLFTMFAQKGLVKGLTAGATK